MAIGGGRGRGSSGGQVGSKRDKSGGVSGMNGGAGGGRGGQRGPQKGPKTLAERTAEALAGIEAAQREANKKSYNPNIEQVPSYPFANPLYGPTQFVGTLPPGPGSIVSGALSGMEIGLADALGLQRGPRMGNSNTQTRSNTGETGLGGSGMGDQAGIRETEEERKKKAAAAKATLLGGISSPLGTEANPQIIT